MKIGILVLASLAITPAAYATTTENPFARDQTLLHVKDLDLATTDDQRSLAIRMDQSARAVCGENMAAVHLAAERKAQECIASVKMDIRRQIEGRLADAGDVSVNQLASAR